MQPRRAGRNSGFSLPEVMVVVAIIGIVAAIAGPSFSKSRSHQRLRDGALTLAATFHHARSEAIRTGNVHAVFFVTDALGSSLTDADGDAVAALVLDDGRPGSAGQNCRIDVGESVRGVSFETDVVPGLAGSPPAAPTDLGAGDYTTGSSFREPGGSDASWVLFRPDGAPLAFDSSCTTGALGSGAGSFYIHNGDRSAAVVLLPTGATRVHTWAGLWSD